MMSIFVSIFECGHSERVSHVRLYSQTSFFLKENFSFEFFLPVFEVESTVKEFGDRWSEGQAGSSAEDDGSQPWKDLGG